MSTPIRSRATILAFTLPVALAVSACFGSSSPTPSATTEPTAAGTSTPAPTLEPTATTSPTATPAPNESAEPSGSAEASGSPSPSGSTGAIDTTACTGTAVNRDWFAGFAGAVSWDVYCAVLPSGWHVASGSDAGTYSLRNGGQLVISYTNGSGAKLQLSEGAFCTSGASACSPRDSTIGDAAFGDLTGTLVNLSSGYALYVGPGSATAYQAVGTGIDEATFRSLTAAVHKLIP